MSFPSINPALGRALAARDYTVPTAVQLAVLEVEGVRDLLVSAQTGSGKTVAFGGAMATTLLGENEKFGWAAEPLALIIAPTRELALQVSRELEWLYAETGAKVVTCVGGMDARTEARGLERGCHIVVGTPGRLRDHLERRRLDLTKLKAVVLDEADEMLDLGFREDLEFILDATPTERQTLLFSATMPRDIETLARSYQRDAERIQTVRSGEQHADIDYQAIRVPPGEVENAVVNVLRFHESRATIVFCSTREGVKRMHARLLERGFSAVALSGELSQNERTHALQALRDSRARVLVATDVAARGLDLPDLGLVIHADLPHDRETLLHRSGRTGRAGKKGLCVVIVPGHRRRKAEALLGAARVRVTWANAPTSAQIRARDQERFLADPIFSEEATNEDRALAATLQNARSADEITLALIRLHLAKMPVPSDIAEDRRPDRSDTRTPARGGDRFQDRTESKRPYSRDRAPSRNGSDDNSAPRAPRAPRVDTRDMVWFRLNIGRDRNADPRWILPLICKAGNVSKSEIGSIKIFDRDTRFQIVATEADAFAESARTNKDKQGHISRVRGNSGADDSTVMAAIGAMSSQDNEPRDGNDEGHDAGSSIDQGRDDRPRDAEASAPRPKAPWRDRTKPNAQGYPKHERFNRSADSRGPDNRGSDNRVSDTRNKDTRDRAPHAAAPREDYKRDDRPRSNFKRDDRPRSDFKRDDKRPAHAVRGDAPRPAYNAPAYTADAAGAPAKPKFPKKDKYAHKKKPRPAEPAAG
ncbi:MAG: DEAD/DEAH box helicase [Hyphomicrobiaceae bacterium]